MVSVPYKLLFICLIMVMVLGVIALTVVFVKSALRRAEQELDAALGGQPVLLRDSMASFFGLASIGRVQVRGNGSLVLTSETLGFRLALSRRPPLLIPRSAIQKVESTRSHLGKMVLGHPLLTVHFVNAAGEVDVVAWLVRDLDRWLAQLGPR